MAPERKLAVILHADIVGSTALVQRDEAVAHQRITDAFHRFSETIQSYRGTVYEIRGDALVAEFPRASDAVSAALAFQQVNVARNEQFADGIAPETRVGISLGEVIIADNTITGPGVVLAQRVEQLAQPGGVCATAAIYEAAPGRLPFDYLDLGAQSAKGFDEPVQVYAVALKADGLVPSPEPAAPHGTKRTGMRAVVYVAIAALVVGGLLAWFQLRTPAFERAEAVRMLHELPDKPSVAVLAFDNLSGASEDERYANGFAANIITALAQLPDLFVVSRHGSFHYKGKSMAPSDIAEGLGVQYLLQGSFQREGDNIRIGAQLIDALSGSSVWSDSYDRKLEDFFSVQDDITLKVVTSLRVQLVEGQSARLVSHQTKDLQAWLLADRSYDILLSGRREKFKEAVDLVERSIQRDPSYVFAIQGLGWIHLLMSPDREGALEVAAKQAEAVLAVDRTFPTTHVLLGRVAVWRGNYAASIEHAKRAIELGAGSPVTLWTAGVTLRRSGLYEEAQAIWRRAKELYRVPPPRFLTSGGINLILLERYAEAAELLRRVLEVRPRERPRLIVALAAMGKTDEAGVEAELLLTQNPTFSAGQWASRVYRGYKHGAQIAEEQVKLLVAAGVPE